LRSVAEALCRPPWSRRRKATGRQWHARATKPAITNRQGLKVFNGSSRPATRVQRQAGKRSCEPYTIRLIQPHTVKLWYYCICAAAAPTLPRWCAAIWLHAQKSPNYMMLTHIWGKAMRRLHTARGERGPAPELNKTSTGCKYSGSFHGDDVGFQGDQQSSKLLRRARRSDFLSSQG